MTAFSSQEPTARLNAAAAVLWRSQDCVQIELGHRRAVLDQVTEADLLPLLPARYKRSGRPTRRPAQSPELTSRLAAAGFLVGAEPDDQNASGRGPDGNVPGHLGVDLAAMYGQYGPDAAGVLVARRQTAVAVTGASRLAASVAAALAAAGVGWVQIRQGGEVSAAHACPGGLTPADEGRRFGMAANDAVRRAAPDVDTSPIPPDRKPDLVVLTDLGPVEPSIAVSLHLDGVAHLNVYVDVDHAVIGPLVVPGVTSCLRCADLHRTDRDPDWPALAVQLSARPRHRTASDVTLCLAAAGVAAGQALSFLDQGFVAHERTATIGGTLEWQLPDWRLRRRSWPAHPRCDCRAVDTRGADDVRRVVGAMHSPNSA